MKISKTIEYPYVCSITNRKFKSPVALSVYITKTLKMNHKDYYDSFLCGDVLKCHFCDNTGRFISIAKGYGNLCNDKECVSKSRSTNSIIGLMYKYDYTEKEAILVLKNKNEKLSIKCKEISKQNTIDNPNYLKENSNRCKEFWIKKGYSNEEANLKLREQQQKNANKLKHKLLTDDIFKENFCNNINVSIQYWIKKGYTKEKAEIKRKERQTTFSKEICIKKYGEEVGLIKWQERQDKWLKALDDKTDEEKIEINRKKLLNNSGYSKMSQDLFWSIYNNFKEHNIIFQELSNREVIMYNHDIKQMYKYDYVDFTNKKVIEFNGDFWHCNPKKYNENYFNKVKQKYANELWNKDKIKNDFVINKGYDLLVVWETDFKQNKEKVIKQCIDFINKKN